MKTNTKIILGIIIAVLLSTVSCYVLAENLINSKDVVYKDNSNLMVDNVQEAIDGTCSKIDTRLSDIEDKLYTVKNYKNGISYTSQTTNFYTGAYIQIPAKSYCGIVVKVVWSQSSPTGAFLSTSSTSIVNSPAEAIQQHGSYTIILNEYFDNAITYYIWASYSSVAANRLEVHGFCATKYK